MVNIAIVGATGVVGSQMIESLAVSDIEVDNLYLLASQRSAGQTRTFRGREVTIEALSETSFDERKIDYALFSAGGQLSLQYAPIAEARGIIVVDNSSAWRMHDDIDLIVPECNTPKSLRDIIANPNCSTIQSVVALAPLAKTYGLKRVGYTTYQAVSGSGQAGLRDLQRDANGEPPLNYPHPIYNNVLPHIDVFLPNGYTKEEQKMIDETRKILALSDDVAITATCVRVPVANAHSVSIDVTLDKPATVAAIRALLQEAPGVIVMDDVANNVYPTPLDASGRDEVFVGRIREDVSQPNSFHLWCVADNLRKGAATNAVQIVAKLVAEKRHRTQ